MSPKEFLEEKGINLNTTSLLTVIDGYMRQPNLCELMDEYAKLKNGAISKPALALDNTKDAILKRFIDYCILHPPYPRAKGYYDQFQQCLFQVIVNNETIRVADGGGHSVYAIISFSNNATVEHSITKEQYDECFAVFINGRKI